VPGNETSPSPPAREPRSGLRHAAIREQLDRVLASPEFQTTDRVRDFLRFVVEETLAGRSDQLKGYTIATAVFGRGDDFDPGQDPIVRIQAGRLRRALERYYLVAGGRDPIVIDVPKGRYVPRFRRYEPAEGVAARQSARPVQPMAPAGPAVAVLPFENLTPDADRLFFTVGLAEELVTELNRYQDVTVIPCHRAPGGAGVSPDLERVGRAAGARFLLGGSIRCDAESAKVAVHLVDATSGRQVWARSFKHSLEAASLIRTQEEIAHSVVAAVASEYGIIVRRLAAESRKKSPAELSTYEAMLRYHTYQIDPTPEASVTCFAALQAAADREPEYGPVWSALATLHCQMYVFDVVGFEDPLQTGLTYARRGVSLEPGRQLSRLILAYANLLAGDLDAFGDEAAATLALNPENPYAVGAIGYMQVLAGRFERGRVLLDRATRTNPFHPHWFCDGYFLECYARGDHQAALEAKRGREDSGFWSAAMMAAALGELDRADEAAPYVAELIASKPDFPGRARELIRRSIKAESLVAAMIAGLQRAGVSIGDG